jgi:very-short-patch-repair endonuclease
MKCEICNKDFKAITGLHLKTHNLTSTDYFIMYPNSKLYPDEVRQKIALKHIGKVIVRTKPMSEQGRKNISEARKGKKYAPSTEEKKAKQRANWAENYEARCLSIKNSYTAERKQRASETQKRIIAERGYHLARGKETKLEILVRLFYEDRGYSVQKQKQTSIKICGSKRYFDVFVPELNLIIEADGEYWHRKIDRLHIDIAKQDYAEACGYNFIRISDAYLKRGKENPDLSIWLSSPELIKDRNKKIIKDRQKILLAESPV